jgi:predicted  nucleic acid-binding Zn-ribbon protein
VTPATPVEQRRLFELQQVDTAIRRLQHRRAHLPEQQALDENAETLARISSDYATQRDRRDRLELQQKRHEAEIATVDARRKAEEGRMYSGLITSERELEALRHEISACRGRKNDLEDALLEIMEQREEVDGLVASLEERHVELTGKVDELTVARDVAATDIDAELAERQRERDAATEALDAELLAVYHDLLGRKDGVAVAELVGRTCQGCRLELTAIELEEFREQSQRALARCAQCSRILVPSS